MTPTPEPALRRLFIGTFLSPSCQHNFGLLKQHEEQLAQEWKRKVRFIQEQKLHLTLLFLGSVEERHLPEIKSRLAGIAQRHQRQKITFTRPQFWPSAKFARNLVVTPETVPAALVALADDTKATMSSFGQKVEERCYRPHVTIMRLESGPRINLQFPDWFCLPSLLPFDQRIETIDLVESHLGRGKDKDKYETLCSRALQ